MRESRQAVNRQTDDKHDDGEDVHRALPTVHGVEGLQRPGFVTFERCKFAALTPLPVLLFKCIGFNYP